MTKKNFEIDAHGQKWQSGYFLPNSHFGTYVPEHLFQVFFFVKMASIQFYFLQVTFPSVTVCNMNRIHCGNLRKILENAYCGEISLDDTTLEDLEYYLYEYDMIKFNCSKHDSNVRLVILRLFLEHMFN